MEDRSMKEEKKTKACKTETTCGIVFVFGKLSNPYIIWKIKWSMVVRVAN